jgi:Uma2 family endonuclease
VATSTTRLMTFAEFQQLPYSPAGRYELRHGEPILAPPPKYGHHLIQRRLRRLLETAAAGTGDVDTEMGFRPRAEHEYLIADVAFLSKERADQTSPDGYIEGAPELVIEVLSPSNTAEELIEKRNLCLESGSREFWVVNGKRRHVEVSTPDGRTITYKSGQEIPLIFGSSLTVDAIFPQS